MLTKDVSIKTNKKEMLENPFHCGFYPWLREKLGLDEEAELDCRKILVSKDVQDVWYDAIVQESDKSEQDARYDLTRMLAIWGPKATLDTNMEILVQAGCF